MANEKVNEILSDATTLEVSSILVEGISGRKMPGISVAYIETVNAWASQCRALLKSLKSQGIPPHLSETQNNFLEILDNWVKHTKNPSQSAKPHGGKIKELEEILDKNSLLTFEDALEKPLKTHTKHLSELSRLSKVQERLLCLNERLEIHFQKKETSSNTNTQINRDMQELRKLWELKDGYIFAQNTVQLDGDIICRQNLRMYQDPLMKERATQLLDFHNKNVDVAMKHWHFIIETIINLAKAVGAAIVSPFR